jgi:hypothetical protein
MTHLTPEEFVDAADGVLDPPRQAHLDACPTCRREVTALAALLREASAAPIPEPSPLFWEHLSARIRRSIADEEVPASGGLSWWRWPVLVPMGALAAALLLLIGSLPHTAPLPSPAAAAAAVPAPSLAPTAGEAGGLLDSTPADSGPWEVVAELVGTLDWDTAGAAGLSVLPGDSDHAALLLSPDEQAELSRLLRGELARSKS